MMRCRIALLGLLFAASACNAPPREKAPVQVAVQAKPAVPALSRRQLYERSEKCGKLAREQFRRAWSNGNVETEGGRMKAEFTSHYNEKLNTCFYLLTVNHYSRTDGKVAPIPGTLKKMLFDVNGGELYGEYLGPAVIESPMTTRPAECRVESFYCASWREWEVLIESYMED